MPYVSTPWEDRPSHQEKGLAELRRRLGLLAEEAVRLAHSDLFGAALVARRGAVEIVLERGPRGGTRVVVHMGALERDGAVRPWKVVFDLPGWVRPTPATVTAIRRWLKIVREVPGAALQLPGSSRPVRLEPVTAVPVGH